MVLCFYDSHFIIHVYTKKRDCAVAVPLHEVLALPIIPNKQHRVHADMYNHTHLFVVCTDIDIHIPRISKCCNVLE